MKPVIITLNSDGKVVISVDEFKRHMDAAYNQGYTDGQYSSITITTYNNTNQWWKDVAVCTLNDACTETLTGSCSSTETTCTDDVSHMSISNYIKSKGE